MMFTRACTLGGFVVLLSLSVGCDSPPEAPNDPEATEATASEAVADDAPTTDPPAKREIPTLPEGEAEDGGLSIAQVMNVAHENKFFRELYKEPADPKAIGFLAGVYKELAKREPPQGADDDWQKRVNAIVESVEAIQESRDGAVAEFKRAVNCNSCHNRHRG